MKFPPRQILKILLFAPLLLLVGCATPNQKAAEASLKDAHIDPSTAGSIKGSVLFSGPAPKPRKLDLSANPTCERQHLKPVFAEDALIGKSGGIENTLVLIESGLPDVRWTAPNVSVTMDQAGCVYAPHMIAMMVGQPLQVSNSDSVNHNVHSESSANAPFNVLEPPKSNTVTHRFDHQELMIPFTCGVHGWMRAYVSVVAHPFFAVTDKDGAFSLKGIPPGDYKVEAIHERFGHQTKAVQLTASASQALDFAYTAGDQL